MFNIESKSNKAFKNRQYSLTSAVKKSFRPIQHVAILLPDDQLMYQEILNYEGKLKLKYCIY